MRHSTLSPKELALALGVSESSVKRWVDSGEIAASRTRGGHRRITLTEAVQYVRRKRLSVVRPDLLGLPEAPGPHADVEAFTRLLVDGRDAEARSFLIGRFLEGTSAAELFDDPLRRALEVIGERWLQEGDGVFVEHRAIEVCRRIVLEMRSFFDPDSEAPLAIGGAIAGDAAALGSSCVEIVFMECGYRAVNLGADTPLSAFTSAVERLEPRYVWVSTSHPTSKLESAEEWNEFIERLRSSGAELIVGGRMRDQVPISDPEVFRGESLEELAAHLRARDDSA